MYALNNAYKKTCFWKKGKNTKKDYSHFFFLFGSLLILHHICGMRENEKEKEETQKETELCSTGYVISISLFSSYS